MPSRAERVLTGVSVMKRIVRDFSAPRKMRRQSRWAVMLGTALAASTAAGSRPAAAASEAVEGQGAAQAAAAAAQDSRQLQFQIPASPLETAIEEYQRVTGLKVV